MFLALDDQPGGFPRWTTVLLVRRPKDLVDPLEEHEEGDNEAGEQATGAIE